jgi:hypothetical protein
VRDLETHGPGRGDGLEFYVLFDVAL